MTNCTCHPSDNPPTPCARKYAFSECVSAQDVAGLVERLADVSRKASDRETFVMGGALVMGAIVREAIAIAEQALALRASPISHETKALELAAADNNREALVEKPEPNPEWEALADAAHAEIVAEVDEANPFDTLTMLDTWKAHAEPANEHGQISFSRALLDSAADALRVALNMARTEHLNGKTAHQRGLQAMREMLACFVEQGGDASTAASLRANWNPDWGNDPGRPSPCGLLQGGYVGPALSAKIDALKAAAQPPQQAASAAATNEAAFQSRQEGKGPPEDPQRMSTEDWMRYRRGQLRSKPHKADPRP